MSAGPVLVAGAGIAGLTAALAFAKRGWPVRVVERAERLEEVGAGLQLSPNASRILFALGLKNALLAVALRPEAVRLIDARSLRQIAHVPLGASGEQRWGAPYLVLHRADLQRLLLEEVERTAGIELRLGAPVSGLTVEGNGVSVHAGHETMQGALLVGADGVGSAVRAALWPDRPSRETGLTAWRATVTAAQASAHGFQGILPVDAVAVFLHPRMHLVAYPVRGGDAFNLVAVAETRKPAGGGRERPGLAHAFTRAAAPLAKLAADQALWRDWPLRTVAEQQPWCWQARVTLIGDAAHAMTPFAAQGAAMAIEDADGLAQAVAARPDDLPSALRLYETSRRPRVRRVARRGAFNGFVWHAAGPVAFVRDRILALRPPSRLAADLDWLYGR